jgi:hypothetical protein
LEKNRFIEERVEAQCAVTGVLPDRSPGVSHHAHPVTGSDMPTNARRRSGILCGNNHSGEQEAAQ